MKNLCQSLRYSGLFIVFLSLVGCGFKLRGTEPLSLQQVFLQTEGVEPLLETELSTALQNHGVNVVTSPTQSRYIIKLYHTSLEQTLTSTSTDMQVRNYIITYGLQYQILRPDGQAITPIQRLSLTRSYTANTTQILNDRQAFSTIRQSLRQEAIKQLFERIRALKLAHT